MPDSFDYTTGTNSENVRLLQALIDEAPEYTEETNSRNANILKSIINNTEYTDAPQSEIEELLLRLKAKIGGEIEVDELTVTENGTYDAGVNKAYNPVNVELPLSSKTITENGTYTASDDNLAGFDEVTVAVEGYAKKSISNTPTPIATFNASALPMPSLTVGIEATQDLHGYDSPWVGGAGRNLFNMGSKWSGTASGLTFSTDDNYVTINGTKNGGTYVTANELGFELSAGTYYVKTIIIGGTASNQPQLTLIGNDISTGDTIGNERTFTLSDTTTVSIRFAFWNDGATFNNYKLGIVVSKTPNIDKFYPYSNICPISGWSAVNVYDDPVYGGTIDFNQLMPISSRPTGTNNDVLITNNGDGSFTLNGTASGNIYADIYTNFQNSLTANHIYMFVVNSTADTVRITNSYGGLNIVTSDKKIVKYTSGNVYVALYVNTGVVVDNVSAYPQCLDLTMIFGENKAEEILAMEQAETGSGVTYVSNLFPKTYYTYNAGTKTCVSAVNGDTYGLFTTALKDENDQPLTCYGGQLENENGVQTLSDVVACDDIGSVSVTYRTDTAKPIFQLLLRKHADETIYSTATNALSSCYKLTTSQNVSQEGYNGCFATSADGTRAYIQDLDYTDATLFKTARAGQKICYKLATPQQIPQQSQAISTQDGTNNLWADSGKVISGEYMEAL